MEIEQKREGLLSILLKRARGVIPSRINMEEELDRKINAVEAFSTSFLEDLGALESPVLQDLSTRETFIQRFSTHILKAIFPPTRNVNYSLDGKSHRLSYGLENSLTSYPSFSTDLSNSFTMLDQERRNWLRAIDLEAKYIFTVMMIPWLKNKGLEFYFVDDFLSNLNGKPQNRCAEYINEDLRMGVSFRLSKLSELLS